jgi:LAO/AO transport system kinase
VGRVANLRPIANRPPEVKPLDKILAGDPRAMARAATWIENRRPEAESLLQELYPHTGQALILGITGPPGAGKSTLCDQLTRELRQQNKTVAILAVDPTSPYSGGAILGDRIRMLRHHADPGVFIRSLATRGWLGGMARATMEMTMLLDGAGFDVVMVETVGVGQDEVEVARLADVTVVVLVPGMGDDVQAIKAGIIEVADVFVINKADLPGADKLETELKAVSHAKIVRTIASEGKGIEEALSSIEECRKKGKDPSRAAHIWSERLREMLRDRLLDRVPEEEFLSGGREVAERLRDPYSVIHDWLERY